MNSIAISGIGCQFPGAGNVGAFWNLIRENQIATHAMPANAATGGDFRSERVGGYMDGIDEFDAEFFGISMREANLMDPQQRLLLQNVWHAIEDAGIAPLSLRESRTGVFVGAMSNDWAQIHLPDLANLNSQTVTGNGFALLANRISYQYDFKGPSLTIDSACSSSLVALNYAIHSLRSGECDYALVAGVNTIITPTLQLFYERAGLAASDGCCKPFSHNSDGIVRGEGVGVVLLQRSIDARNSYAHILGCAVNHNGRSNGLTAPSRFEQEALLRQTYAALQLGPETISYIECHGTGTQLGDRIELRALQSVFGMTPRDTPCHIGSVKSLIGHTEAAAGIAGLIKTTLMLHHGYVPASLYAETPNPALTANSPVQLPTTGYHLTNGSTTRMALSAFGLGGTNAHVVLENREHAPNITTATQRGPQLLLLSAHSSEALVAQAASLAAQRQLANSDLPQLAACSNTLRAHYPFRTALVADDVDQLRMRLAALVTDGLQINVTAARSDPIAFMFTGQGSQYSGMGKALFTRHTAFREAAMACDALFLPLLGQSILSVIFEPNHAELLQRPKFAQPALFTIEYAMARLWIEFGVTPKAVIGHSIGEYAAACIAGVFSLADAVSLVARRAALIDQLPVGGEMLALKGDMQPFLNLLRDYPDNLAVAAYNGRQEFVLSGGADAIASAIILAQSIGMRHRKLDVSHAFHSHLMKPVQAEFLLHCQTIEYRAPTLTFVSALSGGVLSGTPDADYWARHLVDPVLFLPAFDKLEISVAPAFGIEIGPAMILSSLAVRNCLPKQTMWLATSNADPTDEQTLLNGLATLYKAGIPLKLDSLYCDVNTYRLPPYVFSCDSFWHRKHAQNSVAQLLQTCQTVTTEQTPPALEMEQLVRSQVADILGCDITVVRGEARLSEDLGLDSITMIELMEKLNRHLPPDSVLKLGDAVQISTVSQLCHKMELLSAIHY